jgi:DNA-binding helix-hairpin-helix protein with protein kinase domain
MSAQMNARTALEVFDAHGAPQALGKELARGGEGVIYPLAQRQDILIKCYHAQVLDKRGPALAKKVERMVSHSDLFGQPHLAWPRLSVYGTDSRWIGYAMYRHGGVPLFYLAHSMLIDEYFPGLTREGMVALLIHLVQQLQTLHRHGVCLGDFNLHNVLCDPKTLQVVLIDCDSYQLVMRGEHYACPVGSADMTPLEHQGQTFAAVRRTPESEAFSLAIMLFKCLMLGRHPYDIVGGSDPVSNLKSGLFAYGKGNRGVPKGKWYKIWSHMPFKLKSAFITTFQEGASDPQQRTTLEEWTTLLMLYQRELKKGWHDNALVPAQVKPANYRGYSLSQTE